MQTQARQIDLVQGTDEWKEFRNKGIGASDSAAILGCSPWMSAYDLWLKKTGQTEDQRATPAMLRGNQIEETVRQIYEAETGELLMPKVFQHPEIDYIMASLDGITPDNKVILEIKCPRKEVFDKASMGEVVPYYYCQLQHQLACVPEAERVDYVVYWNDKHVILPVERDEEFIADLIERYKVFWEEHVTKMVPPEADIEEYIQIDDPTLELIEQGYAAQLAVVDSIKKDLKIEEEKLSELKQKCLDFTDDGNCIGYHFRYTKKYRSGFDYKQACVDNKIEMRKYYKPTSRWEIKKL